MLEMLPLDRHTLVPIAGMIMAIAIVAIVMYFRHQDRLQPDHVRLREMDHIRRMKKLELQLELVEGKGAAEGTAKPAENSAKTTGTT